MTKERLSGSAVRNVRAWAAARPDMSGSTAIVDAIDELLDLRERLTRINDNWPHVMEVERLTTELAHRERYAAQMNEVLKENANLTEKVKDLQQFHDWALPQITPEQGFYLIPIVSPSALCGLLGCTNQHVHTHDVREPNIESNDNSAVEPTPTHIWPREPPHCPTCACGLPETNEVVVSSPECIACGFLHGKHSTDCPTLPVNRTPST